MSIYRFLTQTLFWDFFVTKIVFRPQIQARLQKWHFFHNAFIACEFNGISGDYVEFGCWSGQTFGTAFRELRRHSSVRHMWAMDSFQGLPSSTDARDEHPWWQPGAMAMSEEDFREACRRNGIQEHNYTTVPGYYEESLSRNDSTLPQNICLAYIDCDMYSSTMTVLEFLLPRLKQGMIIAMDDYHCPTEKQPSGNRSALVDFQRLHPEWTFVPFQRFGWASEAFILERTR